MEQGKTGLKEHPQQLLFRPGRDVTPQKAEGPRGWPGPRDP